MENSKSLKNKKISKIMIVLGIVLFILAILIPILTYVYGNYNNLLSGNESGFAWLIILEIWGLPLFISPGALLFFLGLEKYKKAKDELKK